MSAQNFVNGTLREWWDDATRTYTTYNAAGAQTSTRAYTAAENAAAVSLAVSDTATANGASLRDKAIQGLGVNATFLALAAPTNAQTLAQVQRLSREASGLIRLVLNVLDSTDGT